MLARITFEEIMACYGGNETAYAGLKESYGVSDLICATK